MLHIISTNSDDQLSRLMQSSSTGDVFVAFENIALPKTIKTLETLQARFGNSLLLVSDSENNNHTITHDMLVDLCVQHSSIHTWY